MALPCPRAQDFNFKGCLAWLQCVALSLGRSVVLECASRSGQDDTRVVILSSQQKTSNCRFPAGMFLDSTPGVRMCVFENRHCHFHVKSTHWTLGAPLEYLGLTDVQLSASCSGWSSDDDLYHLDYPAAPRPRPIKLSPPLPLPLPRPCHGGRHSSTNSIPNTSHVFRRNRISGPEKTHCNL